MVYIVEYVSGGRVTSRVPEIMTDVHAVPLEANAEYAPGTLQVLVTVASRLQPTGLSMPIGQILDMGVAFSALETRITQESGEETQVRFLPLTTTNFVVFRDHMIGWDQLATQFTTNESLRENFRDLLLP